jgi:hypothetical protein
VENSVPVENKLLTIIELCNQASEKGYLVKMSHDGVRTGFCHQQAEDYKVVIDISAYKGKGLDCIIAYLKGLIA